MLASVFRLSWDDVGVVCVCVGCCAMIVVVVYRGFCLAFYSVGVVYVWFGGFVVFGCWVVAVFNSAEALRFFVCFW